MKANELMIGDWVYYDGYPMKITELKYKRRGEPPYEQICSVEGVGIGFENVRIDPIKGIPLTPEILEKNADFHRDEMFYKLYDFSKEIDRYGNSMSVEICESKGTVYWTINGNEYGITKLKYVHELQHALKLCGIDKEIVL